MKTALLIDEDQVLRHSLALWLRQAGWIVLEADEGATGLAIALEQKPSLILCDLLAPRYNGFQLCRFLRAKPEKLPGTRIVLTARGGYDVDRETAFQAGADECIVKPILQSDLLRLLHAIPGSSSETQIAARPQTSDQMENDFPPLPPGAIPEGQAVVRFWGVRGSIATPGASTLRYGGNTSCVEVRADGQLIVLDAGTGIRPLGMKLAEEFKEVPLSLTLLITHTHWDHIQGFPFFDPAYDPQNRLRILGYEGAREGLLGALSSQMESPYSRWAGGNCPATSRSRNSNSLSLTSAPSGSKRCISIIREYASATACTPARGSLPTCRTTSLSSVTNTMPIPRPRPARPKSSNLPAAWTRSSLISSGASKCSSLTPNTTRRNTNPASAGATAASMTWWRSP